MSYFTIGGIRPNFNNADCLSHILRAKDIGFLTSETFVHAPKLSVEESIQLASHSTGKTILKVISYH